MANCFLCPNNCGADRTKTKGKCNADNILIAARAALHFFEEPCLVGKGGSGTIFFSNCSMECCYCQNFDISHNGNGRAIGINGLIDCMKMLEKKNAENINLVNPTHYAIDIIAALDKYRPDIPIIWNSGGYEKSETLLMLKDYIDIYLPDMKYSDDTLAHKYSKKSNYVECSRAAVAQMIENQSNVIIKNNIMKKGVMIRHLVLPSNIENSKGVIDYFAENFKDKAYFSLMSQYTPLIKTDFPELNRKLKPIEYKIIVNYMEKCSIGNGFIQDLSSSEEVYVPDFNEFYG